MPRQGGQTTQSGILYQNSVAALYLGDLCGAANKPSNEQVIHVRLETPDEVDDIVVTFADDHKVYIQAKENISSSDRKWGELWVNVSKQYQSTDFKINRDRIRLYFGKDKVLFGDLSELCVRASNSISFDDWMKQCSNSQKKLFESLKENLPPELLSKEAIHQFVACVDVSIMSLQHIETDMVPRMMPQTNRKPKEVFRLFRDRVGREARIGGAFTAITLRNSLRSESPDLVFYEPPDIEKLVLDISSISALLLQHKHTFGNTSLHIDRSIIIEILQWLEEPINLEKNVAMLVDQAGMGKTVIMQDILRHLESEKIVTVAIKADQQLQDVTNSSELQISLNLNYPLDQTIERIAKLGRVVVLIDQIDALSMTLASDYKTLNFTLDFLAKIRRLPNVKIIISCRLFDLNTDSRLRQLKIDRQYSLSFLSEQEIKSVLDNLSVSFKELSPVTQRLLQVPLNLNLFALAISEGAVSFDQIRGINSLQELYGVIWQNVIFVSNPKAPPRAERKEVIDAFVSYMNVNKKTVVPRALFYTLDKSYLERAIDWLISTGIIVDSNKNLSFLHQTFFDYCFARKFVEDGGNIVIEILDSPQGLFERSKLIQVIAYLRDYDFKKYLSSFNQLLSSSNLRFHLYDLLVRWFAAISNPTHDEWLYLYHALYLSERRTYYLLALRGNIAWFDKLNSEEVISKWLSNEESAFIENYLLPYLISLIENRQKEIAGLLMPYIDGDVVWLNRLFYVLSRVNHWKSNDAAELFEKVVYKLPSINRHGWYEIVNLAKTFPKIGCRLIRYAFESNERTAENPGQPTYQRFGLGADLEALHVASLDEAIKDVSLREPALFLQTMAPWVLDSLGEPKHTDLPDYWFEWDIFCDGWNIEYHEVRNALIFGLINSLVQLGKTSFREAQKWIDLFKKSPFRTPQRIIARVFALCPEICFNQSLEFLLEDQRRLQLGENAQYDSRQLIMVIFPFLTAKQRTDLEDLIVNYRPIYKRWQIRGLNRSGLEQLYLLQSLPEVDLSPTSLKRLRELERKFPGEKAPSEEKWLKSGSVTSPISKDVAVKMSDRAWLAAMRKYRGQREHKDFLRGGAAELSGVLTELIKENPARFYNLLESVPAQIDENYSRAFIQGFSESTVEPEWVFNAIRRFISSVGLESRRTICWVLEKRSKYIPEDLIEWLNVIVHESVGEDEWWWSKGKNHGDAFQNYINSDRGAAFNALITYYREFGDDGSILKQWEMIEYAAADPSTALRAGAIHELIFMIRFDRIRAIELFEQLVRDHEILLTLMYTREFLYWSFSGNFLRLSPYIIQMMNSKIENVRNQGAQLACIALISSSVLESEEAIMKARQLVEASVGGEVDLRRGAATIFSHNLANHPEDVCEKYLSRLLNDEDEQVREIIDRVFDDFDGEHIFSKKKFIESYSLSSRIIDRFYAEFMLTYGMIDPQWAIAVIRGQINNLDLGSGGWHSGTDELIRLVLKIYTSTTKDDLQKEAMDVFDELLKRFSASAYKALSEWDSK